MKRSVLLVVAMLAVLNMVTQAQAVTICVSRYVCDDRPPALEAIQPPTNIPVVFDISPIALLPYQDSTGWYYEFSVPYKTNAVDMPYFADSSILAVGTPDGWTYSVGALGAEGKTTASWQKLLESSTAPRIFSFKSNYSPSEAIYQFTFDDGSKKNYQLFVPFSPLAQASGYTSFTASVPEPSAIHMASLGFVACAAATWRRRMVI